MEDEEQFEELSGGMEIHVGSGPQEDAEELVELPAELPAPSPDPLKLRD